MQRFIFILSFSLFAFQVRAADSETRIVPHRQVIAHPSCGNILTTVTNALADLGTMNGRAWIGPYAQLEDTLLAAGYPEQRRTQIIAAIERMRVDWGHVPLIHNVFDAFTQMADQQQLLVCAVTSDCSLAQSPTNHLAVTGAGQEAIAIVTPASDDTPREWAINFVSLLSMIAGDRFIGEWVIANYRLELLTPGSGDRYYREYYSHFRGSFEDLNPRAAAFAEIIYHFYRDNVTFKMFELDDDPRYTNAVGNRAITTMAEFLRGLNSENLAPIARELGLTEENYLRKSDEILEVMLETRRKARDLH